MTNGDQAAERAKRAAAAAKSAAAKRKRTAPLRKVVKREVINDRLVETLECGHRLEPVAPLFGGVGPNQRRCLKCLEALEKAHEDLEG